LNAKSDGRDETRTENWHFSAAARAAPAVVTVAVPSINHGRFLDEALCSIAQQRVATRILLADAGSRDETADVIARWEPRLAGWRSGKDAGQAAAINEAIALDDARYVCWMNADDTFLPGGLDALAAALDANPTVPMVYGRAWVTNVRGDRLAPAGLMPVTPWILAQRCPISQPATLIRRSVWEALGGLDERLQFALDYDLWWRVLLRFGSPLQIVNYVATTRAHMDTKTARARQLHYDEAVSVVRRHYGRVPIKWRIAWPISVGARTLYYRWRTFRRQAGS
jgi:glycosyltransferase involved in cell wall biosynthesis